MTEADAARKAFQPWQLGPLRLRNRCIKSATNEGMAKNGVPSLALLRHHRRIAAGGVGMTTLAYCATEPDGRTFEHQIVLGPESRPQLRAITAAVQREGAAACAQITHGGAFNFLPKLSRRYPLSASGGFNAAGLLSGRLFKTAARAEELTQLKEGFVRAAREAGEAGFNAVELHMGHGYLLSQFLSPRYNHRRDGLSGSAEARTHFPVEVLSAVLDAVGSRMAVSCKLSMVEGFAGGGTLDDALVTARALSEAGAHLLVLSAGMNVESPWQIFGSPMGRVMMKAEQGWLMRQASRVLVLQEPPLQFKELYLLEQARVVRQHIATPLAYLGGAKSLAGIAQVMQEGFDAVVLGRALLHQPDLIADFAAGRQTQSGCTACNQCIATMYGPGGTHCVLTQTPDVDGAQAAANEP